MVFEPARKAAMERRLLSMLASADIIASVSRWPGFLTAMLLNPRKPRGDRFKLFVFFVRNGVEPSIAGDWVGWWNKYAAEFTTGDGITHIQQMVADMNSNVARRRFNYFKPPYYDLELRRVQYGPQTLEAFISGEELAPLTDFYSEVPVDPLAEFLAHGDREAARIAREREDEQFQQVAQYRPRRPDTGYYRGGASPVKKLRRFL